MKNRSRWALPVLVVTAFWIVAPVLLMVFTSLRSSGIAFDEASSRFSFDNYELVLQEGFGRSLAVSGIVSTLVAILSLLLGFPAAYGLARGGGRLVETLGAWIFSSRFLPAIVAAIPLFIVLRWIGLAGTIVGLVLVELLVGLGFAVWVLRSYLSELGPTLDDLCATDGLTTIRRLQFAFAPAIAPAIVSVGALTWLLVWNEYILALLFSGASKPVTVAIASWNTYQGIRWGPACAAGVLAAVPAALLLRLGFEVVSRSYRPR